MLAGSRTTRGFRNDYLAKVNEGTAAVGGAGGTIGNLLTNELNLVLVLLEHLDGLLLGQDDALKWLLLLMRQSSDEQNINGRHQEEPYLDDLVDQLLDSSVLVLTETATKM